MSNIFIYSSKPSNPDIPDREYKVQFVTFSDKTEMCKILKPNLLEGQEDVLLQVDIQDGTRDIVRTLLVKDALDRLGVKSVRLTLGYMPQARADRVFEKGQSLPIKVFADMINSAGFTKVYLDNPHSDVTPALINNVVVHDQHQCFKGALPQIRKEWGDDFLLCAPDNGATKKVFDSVTQLGHKSYVQVIKVRDVTTGDIVRCELATSPEDFKGKTVVIVDDISDGGASFNHVAALLKENGAKSVILYVTHGIFAKGLEPLVGHIDAIYVTGFVGNYINHENVRKFNEGAL